ncbi:hypothetical protein ACOACO_09515 [Nocardioides sp. CPCC 205120]|uniref:metallophosphoesterase family protein n=1 Tax=Nocardioides sp. CPCC 205120 TaxID=3406462 RepID=UPI003B50CE46
MIAPTTATATAAPSAAAAAASSDPVGDRALLTDPFLQAPTADGVSVVWFTEFAGSRHAVLVGEGVAGLGAADLAAAASGTTFPGVTLVAAETSKLSQVAEDYQSNIPVKPAQSEGIVDRDVWRHEGAVTGLQPGTEVPYRVVSLDGSATAGSGTFTLQPAAQAGDDLDILLTSDHQAMVNTPANLHQAAATIGDIDAVFLAGDLVNIPDRASEWFDDTRGSGFFPVLQGNGGRTSTGGVEYAGGEIVQNAPLYPAVGNHEVQGRRAGATALGASFNAPVPRSVAETAYEAVAADVNPSGDPAVREQWIVDNSFSTTTYEEIFSLPDTSPGGETYYATTVGDVRLVSLYSTRIWRGTTATPDPAARTASSRYQEAQSTLDAPLAQGYGEHIFEAIDASSEQYDWLQDELASEEFTDARYRVVMLHEGPQGLGDNVMPQFADPERIEERDDAGNLVGVRYEYPATENELLYDLQPLLEDAGVDLVHNGHSHLWNRFVADNGTTNFLETSNTGNSYGAYHPLSGRSRPVPPAPWNAENYWAQDNPGGLEPIVPNVAPYTNEAGTPLPFVQDNNLAVFTKFNTGSGEITTYSFDVRTPDVAPKVIDVFSIGRPDTEPDPEPEPEPEPELFTATATRDATLSRPVAGDARATASATVLRTSITKRVTAWARGRQWTATGIGNVYVTANRAAVRERMWARTASSGAVATRSCTRASMAEAQACADGYALTSAERVAEANLVAYDDYLDERALVLAQADARFLADRDARTVRIPSVSWERAHAQAQEHGLYRIRVAAYGR